MKTNKQKFKNLKFERKAFKKKFEVSQNTQVLELKKILMSWSQKRKKGKNSDEAKHKTCALLKISYEKPKTNLLTAYGLKSACTVKPSLSLRNKSFFASLVKIDVFVGDTYIRSHLSQGSFIYASRNNHDIYDLQSSYLGLKRAMQFLNMQEKASLIFVGQPAQRAEECKLVFAKHKIRFFSSELWIPGFISKNTTSIKRILVIYDIDANEGAKNEAIRANLPIVGFVTKYANINGVDYPVCMNFENCGSWYSALWNTFFLKAKTKK